MNAAKILDRNEIWTVLDSFERERKKNKFPLNPQKERLRPNAWVNLILFRLSVCCGLRVSELCNLVIGDIMITGPRPSLRVRANATKATRQIKGKTTKKACGRIVPLYWDNQTLRDLTLWYMHRIKSGAKNTDPFICSPKSGKKLNRDLAAKRFKTAIRSLGKDRVSQLHIHCGRHTAISHALASGRGLVEVRDFAGHKSITTTNIYLHYVAVLNGEKLPDVFARPITKQ